MNGIGVELADDAGLGLVLPEAEHSETRYKDDGRARIAQRRGVGCCEVVVIGAVLFTIFNQRSIDLRLQIGNAATLRPRHKHGANLGADEMIRATSAEVSQLFSVRGIHELQNIRCIAKARNVSVVRAQTGHADEARYRQQASADRCARERPLRRTVDEPFASPCRAMNWPIWSISVMVVR